MVVKFQVERRPIAPSGKVIYGRERGDGVAILSNPDHKSMAGAKGISGKAVPLTKTAGTSTSAYYIPMNVDPKTVPPVSTSSGAEVYSDIIEQVGEPWLVFSSHHSVDAAIAAAAPLAAAIGAANVRIIKVLSHTTEFKLS